MTKNYPDGYGHMRVDAMVTLPSGTKVFEPGLWVMNGPYPSNGDEYVDLLVCIPDLQKPSTFQRVDGIRCMGCKYVKSKDCDILIVYKSSLASENYTAEDEEHYMKACLKKAYVAAERFEP